MDKFSIGDVILNPWVTENSPLYKCVYMGKYGSFFKAMINGGEIVKYCYSGLKKFKPTGEFVDIKNILSLAKKKESISVMK